MVDELIHNIPAFAGKTLKRLQDAVAVIGISPMQAAKKPIMALDVVGLPGQIPELTPILCVEFADDRSPESENQRAAFFCINGVFVERHYRYLHSKASM